MGTRITGVAVPTPQARHGVSLCFSQLHAQRLSLSSQPQRLVSLSSQLPNPHRCFSTNGGGGGGSGNIRGGGGDDDDDDDQRPFSFEGVRKGFVDEMRRPSTIYDAMVDVGLVLLIGWVIDMITFGCLSRSICGFFSVKMDKDESGSKLA